MKILLTGICGYVGSRLACRFKQALKNVEIIGIDNLSRRGSESSLATLKKTGAKVFHGDLRNNSDLNALPKADWVVDCAANPSVMAGISLISGCTSEQLVEHNLVGTLNMLEYCKKHSCGLVLLSTSRVYSVDSLISIPLIEASTRFKVKSALPKGSTGISSHGISEEFPANSPISLYGATKLASETMALEYGLAFNFPVWINRCGVIGGPGQFGKIDQGIFSFWVYSCALGRKLKYIGFGGKGKQVRDCVTAEDVADLVMLQIKNPNKKVERIVNVGGGNRGAMSLLELTQICQEQFKCKMDVAKSKETRPYDIPYFVTDIRKVKKLWNWQPTKTAHDIVLDLCRWTSANMDFVRNL